MKNKDKRIKPLPPEDETDELLERCTCDEYDWKTVCPFLKEIRDLKEQCNCCPYHYQKCLDNI